MGIGLHPAFLKGANLIEAQRVAQLCLLDYDAWYDHLWTIR